VNNAVLGAAAAHLFDKVTNNLVDAVGKRAKQLYG
jgi:ribosome-associated toxin RatA of RatAB toxin-antitoxin module